jgi:hypothetical protein
MHFIPVMQRRRHAMLRTMMAGLVLALCAAAPVLAQDAYMSPMDFSAQTQALTSSAIDNNVIGNVARGERGAARARPAPSARGALGFSAGRRVSDARLPFASTPATQRQALGEYLARLRSTNPRAAADVQRAFAGVNIHQRFADAVRPNGLRANDAADVMTAFLVMGWEIVNQREPSDAGVRGVRRQVAAQLLAQPQMRSPGVRTRFGEELKIQFMVIASGARSAPKEGKVAAYRRDIAGFYRRITGQDLARLGLTPGGFVRR